MEALDRALDALEAQIRFFRGALQERERGATRNMFASAREWFDGEPG